MTETSLRERKKGIIRQEVIKAAEHLFEEKGSDAVTVADIADAANISIKTLFTYFRSKEDLLFQDSSLIDTILADLKDRKKDRSPAITVASTLIRLLKQSGTSADTLAAYQKGYGESEALRSRMLRLWADYESEISQQLAEERGQEKPTADIRYLAALLVTLLRSVTWKETHEMVTKNQRKSSLALSKWLEKKAAIIEKIV